MSLSNIKIKNLILSMMILFMGCSSSDSGGTFFNTTQEVNTQAIDGYIKDALICIDINKNNKCEDDEPQAKSNIDGKSTIHIDSNYHGNYNLLVYGGIDTTTNNLFIGTLRNTVDLDNLTTEMITRITPLTTLAVIIADTKSININRLNMKLLFLDISKFLPYKPINNIIDSSNG